MKAVVSKVYGNADVLQLAEVEQPRVEAEDALIRVRAGGVDRGVWHVMAGKPYAIRLAMGLRRPRLSIRGREFAGVVEAVGSRVTGFRPGDEVYGTSSSGSWAEFTTARPATLAIKPRNVSFEQAAVSPISGGTALQAVRDVAAVQQGQRVLVIGSGGVGSFAIQIAKAYGATVTAICSPSHVDGVRKLGAVDVLDYTRDEIDRDGPVYDAIIDTGGNRPLPLLRRALVRGGIAVIVGAENTGAVLGMGRMIRAPFASMVGSRRLKGLLSFERAAVFDDLRQLIESGAVTPLVDRVYPAEQAVDAMRRLTDGHPAGKVALTFA